MNALSNGNLSCKLAPALSEISEKTTEASEDDNNSDAHRTFLMRLGCRLPDSSQCGGSDDSEPTRADDLSEHSEAESQLSHATRSRESTFLPCRQLGLDATADTGAGVWGWLHRSIEQESTHSEQGHMDDGLAATRSSTESGGCWQHSNCGCCRQQSDQAPNQAGWEEAPVELEPAPELPNSDVSTFADGSDVYFSMLAGIANEEDQRRFPITTVIDLDDYLLDRQNTVASVHYLLDRESTVASEYYLFDRENTVANI